MAVLAKDLLPQLFSLELYNIKQNSPLIFEVLR